MQVCRICLVRDVELHDIDICGLKESFEALTNCLLSQDGFPECLCWECRARLLSCARFREKALRSQMLLAAATLFQQCNLQQIERIDRDANGLMSCLTSETHVDHYDAELRAACAGAAAGCGVKREPEPEQLPPDLSSHQAQLNEPMETSDESSNDKKPTIYAIDQMNNLKVEAVGSEDSTKDTGNSTPERIYHDVDFNNFEYDEGKDKKFDIEQLSIQNAEDFTSISVRSTHICNECDAVIEGTGNFVEHQETHKEKPYKCHKCNYRAALKIHLQRHVTAVHLGDRSYKCNRCAYTCCKKDRLQQHLMTHSGERPFRCICGYECIEKKRLRRHIDLDRCQTDVNRDETPQLNKPAETLHESRDDEKVKVHAIVEDDTSHTKIDESVNHNMKTIVNLTHGNMHNQDIGTKNPNSDKIVYIKPDPEELPTQTAASKTDSQHVMALQIADRSFKCCRCDHVCNRKRSLLRHLMVHSGERPFMCSCGSKYIQKKHLERHIQQNGCQAALTQEQVQHLENQQYTVARTVQSSAEHVKTNLVAFECDECGKGYHLKSELRKHILTHMLLEESLNVSGHTFSCTVCHNTFATKVVLSDHVKSQHPAHFETVQKCRLLLRQQKHTGEKPYKCDSCDYKSARKANLKQHVICKHVNKKPFKCRHCESRFNLETNLRAHELVHTGEKPYKCRYCSFTSGHYSSVCTHQKLHSGDKPHKCGLCNYRAARKQNIKIHVMNVHTREKPFKCDRCDYACRLKSQMKEHVVVHTSEKPYKCEVCNYACKRIAQLKRHVKRHKSGVNC